jgi:hypothetical protein
MVLLRVARQGTPHDESSRACADVRGALGMVGGEGLEPPTSSV